jgi:TP901 family phage tail tape measure protein
VPLSGRDVFRRHTVEFDAKDNASPTINRVQQSMRLFGQGLAFRIIGRGMSQLGDKMLRLAGAAAKFTMQWDNSMQGVQTQAQLGQKQFAKLSDAALKVVAKYPAAADEVAQGLFDIFSSIDVNYKQAIKLIDNFDKAATAGGTDIRTVARGVIAEMNAFKLPVTSVTRLLDLQFQMVRVGVGTYDEFVSALGNVIPSAKAAGQTLETMSGAVAFMSRNGLTAAQSTISVARALDMLTRHRTDIKTVLGIDIVDKATGKYKQLGDIMSEFNKQLAPLTDAQRMAKLNDIFGAGEIRANRFFRVAIPNSSELNDLIGRMGGKQVAGQMSKAFDIMKASPVVQLATLRNRLKVIAITIVHDLLPAALQLIKPIDRIVGWVERLDPATKALVGKLFIFSALLLAVGGRVFLLIGGLKSLLGLLLFFAGDGGIGAFVLATAGWLIAIAAIGVAAYYMLTHWEKVKKWFNEFVAWWDRNWNNIKNIAAPIIAALGVLIGVKLVLAIKSFAETVKDAIISFTKAAWALMMENPWLVAAMLIVAAIVLIIMHWGAVKRFLIRVWNDIKKVAFTVWDAIMKFFHSNVGKTVTAIFAPWILVIAWLVKHWRELPGLAKHYFTMILDFITGIWDKVRAWTAKTWNELKSGILAPIFISIEILFKGFLNTITMAIRIGWDIIHGIIFGALKMIWGILRIYLAIFIAYWRFVWDMMLLAVRVFWRIIGPIFMTEMKVAFAIIRFGLTVIWNLWRIVWAGIAFVLEQAWNVIKLIIKIAWAYISFLFKFFLALITGNWVGAWNAMKGFVFDVWKAIKGFVFSTWNAIKGFIFTGLSAVQRIWNGAWKFVKSVASDTWDGIKKVISGSIKSVHDIISTTLGSIKRTWNTIWGGFQSGISTFWNGIIRVIGGAVNVIIDIINGFVRGIYAAVNAVAGIFGKHFNAPQIPHVHWGEVGGTQQREQQFQGGGGQRRFAKGKTDHYEGWGWVGEEGPELRYVRRHDVIIPHRTSKQLAKVLNLPGFKSGIGSFLSLLNPAHAFGSVHVPQVPPMIHDILVGMLSTIKDWTISWVKGVAGRIIGGGGALPPPGGTPVGINQAIGAALSGNRGWAKYWGPLQALWTRESGWNNMAYNRSSGAFGIPQALPFTKMPKAAWPPWAGGTASASSQIIWGLNYIAGRYGNPAAAFAHDLSLGWYGRGADFIATRPMVMGVGDRRERVTVTPVGSALDQRSLVIHNHFTQVKADSKEIQHDIEWVGKNQGWL